MKTYSDVKNFKATEKGVKAELLKEEMIVEPSALFRKVNESSCDGNKKTVSIPKILKTAQTSQTVVSAITEHVSDKP